MICTNCNKELMPGAQFCSNCGTRIHYAQAAPFPPAPVYPPLAYSRVARHIQPLGILWIVYAVWSTLKHLVGLAFLHKFLGSQNDFGWGSGFDFGQFSSFVLWPSILVSAALTLVLSLLAAYGLLHRQSWGRIMAIICAIFALIHPLLGTALGIYTLWVLAPTLSGVEYNAITSPPPTMQQQPS